MTVKELAKKYGYSIYTIRGWIREKKIKAKPTPTGYIINEEKFIEFLETRGKK